MGGRPRGWLGAGEGRSRLILAWHQAAPSKHWKVVGIDPRATVQNGCFPRVYPKNEYEGMVQPKGGEGVSDILKSNEK